MGSQSVALDKAEQGTKIIRKVLESGKSRLQEALANCPLRPEQLISQAMVACHAEPKLANADPISVLLALTEAAQAQLQVNGALADGWLIPRWNSKRGTFEAHFQIGYRGLVNLALRSGKLTHVAAEVVYEADMFDIEEGMRPSLKFKRSLAGDRGAPIGVFAIAYLRDSPNQIHPFQYMSAGEVNHIKDMYSDSSDRSSSPWQKEWPSMWKKTALRQLMKYAQLSPQSQQAALLDEYHEAGVRTETERAELDVPTESAKPPAPATVSAAPVADLKEKINSQKKGDTDSAGKVSGTISKIAQAKTEKGATYLKVQIAGREGTIFVWDAKLHGFLAKSDGKLLECIVQTKGGYDAMTEILRVGETQYENGLPVIQVGSDGEPENQDAESPESGQGARGLAMDDEDWSRA